LPKIHAYYDQVLADFSINDMTHALHYLLKILQNMQRLDAAGGGSGDESADESAAVNV
jgi:hypothetical protein